MTVVGTRKEPDGPLMYVCFWFLLGERLDSAFPEATLVLVAPVS